MRAVQAVSQVIDSANVRNHDEPPVLPGMESTDPPPEEMPERHDDGKNLIGTVGIERFTTSYILRGYNVLARHTSFRMPTATHPLRCPTDRICQHL